MNAQEQILTKVLNCRRIDLFIKENDMNDRQRAAAKKMMERFESGEPLQHILEEVTFCDVRLKVNGDAFIPRPETELLVEHMVKQLENEKHFTILDLGTGSGCISIALAKALPKARLFAIDISDKMIQLAMENAQLNQVEDQITFMCDDMNRFLQNLAGRLPAFQVIVSNPPYIATPELDDLPEDVKREPHLALDGGEDGLDFYRTIIASLDQWVTRQGKVYFEIGETQAEAIQKLFLMHPFCWQTQVIQDYTLQNRIFEARRSSLRWIN